MSGQFAIPKTPVNVKYNTDLWPFKYEFSVDSAIGANDGCLPHGAVITAVTMKAYLGNVDDNSDLSTETDITSDFIDPSYAPTPVDNIVQFKVQYPGEEHKGLFVSLLFEITISPTATNVYFAPKQFKITGNE